jgi:hypothetical protein
MFPEVPTRAESWRIFKNPSKRGVCCGLSGLKKPNHARRKRFLRNNRTRCGCRSGKFSQSIHCKTPMKQPLADRFETFFQKGIVSLKVLGLTVLVLTNNAVQSR